MSGKRMSEVMARFIEEAGKEDPKFYSDRHLEGIEQGRLNGNDAIFSYGRHFPLAEIMPDAAGNRRGWWLLNGDRWRSGSSGWGVSTSSQQSEVRRLAESSGLPFLTVPFSALNRAGIRHGSIKIVEELPERYTWEPRTRDKEPLEYERHSEWSSRGWQQLENGQWAYEAAVHHLGEAVFEASYEYWQRQPAYMDLQTHLIVRSDGEYVRSSAYFLSAFDENEPGFGLYFLAQLPDGAQPSTVSEAREALKPDTARLAEADGLEVLRQGDVFAVPRPQLQTRDLPGPGWHSEYVLGVNHMVTEIRTESGRTFGRGVMRHRPREYGRQPEHRALKLGDGKTWYELVKNTVPEGRSWSLGGNAD